MDLLNDKKKSTNYSLPDDLLLYIRSKNTELDQVYYHLSRRTRQLSIKYPLVLWLDGTSESIDNLMGCAVDMVDHVIYRLPDDYWVDDFIVPAVHVTVLSGKIAHPLALFHRRIQSIFIDEHVTATIPTINRKLYPKLTDVFIGEDPRL